VVLIGNAAAALQGAPVTADFDFMFRRTAVNLQKLKALASRLGATVGTSNQRLWTTIMAKRDRLTPDVRPDRLTQYVAHWTDEG
jgi:hypothetical protein